MRTAIPMHQIDRVVSGYLLIVHDVLKVPTHDHIHAGYGGDGDVLGIAPGGPLQPR